MCDGYLKQLVLSLQQRVRTIAPLSPYIAVGVGLFVCRSAWAAVLCYQVLALIIIVVCRPSVSWNRPRQALPWLTAVLFGGTGLVLALVWPYLAVGAQLTSRLIGYGLSGANFGWFGLWFCLANPVLEELLWRGVLLREERLPSWTDLLFGGYHALVMGCLMPWPWIVVGWIGCALAGWIWRVMLRWSGGLLIPAAAHFLADASIMGAVWWLCYR